ncbi:MAG: DNA-3-methyladenine glycosylase I [bacterium]|nr:DNA-3-methyladenine glycosylase I [bacterium]
MAKLKQRCWPTGNDPLMDKYHDHEWGRPVHDDHTHFEYLILDSFQAGLSWRTILHKRKNFTKAFSNFNVRAVAKYGAPQILRLMADAGIIRNHLKIKAAVKNARAFLALQKKFGSFDTYIWQFVGKRVKQNRFTRLSQLPASSPESDAMSKDLKQRGFSFVGTTICYAYMQGAGLVNDHLLGCPAKRGKKR